MTYIFGHKRPDTDSVCSAIALSYLKNSLGFSTDARILDEINNETSFVLKKFNVPVPKILNDVFLQIKDINYKRDIYIEKTASLMMAYNMMNDLSLTALPIVDNKKLVGFISMKDIARINFDFENRLETSYDNILNLVSGSEVIRHDNEIVGDVLVASYKSTTFIDNVNVNQDTILIVGDRHSVIEYAVNSGAKLIIVTGDSLIKDEHLKIASLNKVNVIRTSFDTYKVSRMINFANYVNMDLSSVAINENMLLDEFKLLSNKNKYSNYPVVDDYNNCLGMIRLIDLSYKNPKKVILVDHNELSQSVDGIEQAYITEVIDHHKIGDIASKVPINFRNMTVGSTCSIIYLMYKESSVLIPENILGLLMSGIISDTMLLNSPTTTDIDRTNLVEISNLLNIDYIEYGKEMFQHGSSLKGRSIEEIIYTDFKNFFHGSKKIGIGQLMTTSITEIEPSFKDIVAELNNIASSSQYDVVAFFITDIVEKGSYLLFSDNSKAILEGAFETDLRMGFYFDHIVSRKTQIMPPIIEYLDQN